MNKIKIDKDLTTVETYTYNNCAKPSKEPNDGYFIEKNSNDSFSSEGCVRYGEEQDADDL